YDPIKGTLTSSTPRYLHPGFIDLPPPGVGLNSYFKSQKWSVFDTWCKRASNLYPPEARPAGANPGWPYFRDEPNNIEGWWPYIPYNPSTAPNGAQPYHMPLPIRILAIQITVRIWDQKTEQTRQVSIIQNM